MPLYLFTMGAMMADLEAGVILGLTKNMLSLATHCAGYVSFMEKKVGEDLSVAPVTLSTTALGGV